MNSFLRCTLAAAAALLVAGGAAADVNVGVIDRPAGSR